MSNTEWRAVVGFEGLYEVSDGGFVRRIGRARGAVPGRVLSPGRTKHGHLYVNLKRPPLVVERRYVHRIVAVAFLRPHGTYDVNHIDGDPSNNRVANLECVSHSENITHGFRVLRRRRAPSRFTPSDIADMRARVMAGEQQKDVARHYGCAQSYVSLVSSHQRRSNW